MESLFVLGISAVEVAVLKAHVVLDHLQMRLPASLGSVNAEAAVLFVHFPGSLKETLASAHPFVVAPFAGQQLSFGHVPVHLRLGEECEGLLHFGLLGFDASLHLLVRLDGRQDVALEHLRIVAVLALLLLLLILLPSLLLLLPHFQYRLLFSLHFGKK